MLAVVPAGSVIEMVALWRVTQLVVGGLAVQ